MKSLPITTDNIADLLTKIVEFTRIRRKVLTVNIQNVDIRGYYPQDLEVDDFCSIVSGAIAEHCQNGRLVLRDTISIKFKPDGGFEARAVLDRDCKKLLEENRNEYLERQLEKLLENTLNEKIAKKLLCQQQSLASQISGI